MNLNRIQSQEHKHFNKAMKLYENSFPSHEKRDIQSILHILHKPEYHCNYIDENDTFLGILFYWETKDFIYIEHFAIEPAYRGQQYGERALKKIQQKDKPIILEIDPPITDIARRRESFYQNLGYEKNPFIHLHPPYEKNGQPYLLQLMSFPHQITKKTYHHFFHYLEHKVM